MSANDDEPQKSEFKSPLAHDSDDLNPGSREGSRVLSFRIALTDPPEPKPRSSSIDVVGFGHEGVHAGLGGAAGSSTLR